MSNYISLEDLKKLDPKSLKERWTHSRFPFEFAKCHFCVTMHKTHPFCMEHPNFIADATAVLSKWPTFDDELPSNLEAIYSLRLFYKDLYANNPPEIMAEPAPNEERVKV